MKVKRWVGVGVIGVVVIVTAAIMLRRADPELGDATQTVVPAETAVQSGDQPASSGRVGEVEEGQSPVAEVRVSEEPAVEDSSPEVAESRPDDLTSDTRDTSSAQPEDPFFRETQDTAKELHKQFERERRDEQWAPYMELQISDFVARQPFGDMYSVSSECRATLCEVRAEIDAAILEADRQSNPDYPRADWQVLMYEMVHESLGTELERVTNMVQTRDEHPNRVYYLTILRRRQ